jgi:hypothetical protein
LSLAADNWGMVRPLRFVRPKAIVEVTTRTVQGRLPLRPPPELTDITPGVIGKAQHMYGMAIRVGLTERSPSRSNGHPFTVHQGAHVKYAAHYAEPMIEARACWRLSWM